MNEVVVKRWLYQDQLNPVAELDSLGNLVSLFAPGYIVKNDSTYALITDHLGSVRLVVNVANGNVVQRIDYDAFGNEVLNTNPDFQPFGYAGGLYAEQTKLVRFGARDYDASIGRWTNKDPIGFGGGLSNLYEYVVNDPLNRFDKNGLQSIDPLRYVYEQASNEFNYFAKRTGEIVTKDVPKYLDWVSLAATALGQPEISTGLGILSTGLTLLGEDYEGGAVSCATTTVSFFSKNAKARILTSIIQLGFDYRDALLGGINTPNPKYNPNSFMAPDNTFVKRPILH